MPTRYDLQVRPPVEFFDHTGSRNIADHGGVPRGEVSEDAVRRRRVTDSVLLLATGAEPSMSRRHSRIGGQFAPRLIGMLESPAYRVLSLSARKVLDRIEIELAHHGGRDNGRLPVTYDDFMEYGIHRHSVRPAINELIALGFVEITKPGRAGNAEFREPNLFRLTYRPADGVRGDGTHEWKAIKSDQEAERAAGAARNQKTENRCRKSPPSSDGKRHRKSKTNSSKTIATAHSSKTGTTLNISGMVSPAELAREARLPQGAVASEPADHNEHFFGSDETHELPRIDLIQSRVADRIGKEGWAVLMLLEEAELDRVIMLETQGMLDEVELIRLRQLATQRRLGDGV